MSMHEEATNREHEYEGVNEHREESEQVEENELVEEIRRGVGNDDEAGIGRKEEIEHAEANNDEVEIGHEKLIVHEEESICKYEEANECKGGNSFWM